MSASEQERGRPAAVSRLGRWLGLTPLPVQVADEMAALRGEVSRLAQANVELQAGQAQSQDRLAALSETLERLEKQTTRAGKEQFKANALAESQQQTAKALLEHLREAESVREREVAQLRDALQAANAEGRRDVFRGLLPVMDGLSEALAAGERLLGGRPLTSGVPPIVSAEGERVAPLPLVMRLVGAWELLTGQSSSAVPETDREALAAWLRGLALVQSRLLDLLAAEGIYPIAAAGQAFDPHQHVAVDTVPAAPGLVPGLIVQETRRGYRQGQTVLRYAEVIVAK